jgi:hypothetical protein
MMQKKMYFISRYEAVAFRADGHAAMKAAIFAGHHRITYNEYKSEWSATVAKGGTE